MTFLNFGIKESVIILFVREFSIMIEAGLSIISSLSILHKQQRHKKFAETIEKVKKAIEEGETLSESFAKFPEYFDLFFIGMVRAGEASGLLDVILRTIADYKERSFKLKKKIKAAMIYPMILFAAAIVIAVFILVYVIPVFKNIFAGSGESLPFITEIVIASSEFVKRYLYYILSMFFVLYLLFSRSRKMEYVRIVIDKVMLRLPVLGGFFLDVAVARFTRTTGILFGSGVSIVDSFLIASKTAGNGVIEKGLYDVRSKIIKGEGLSDSLSDTGLFPDMVCHMVAVGESTGALDVTLGKVADFYDEQIESSLEKIVALIEPVMILFLGILIGFLLLAMYLPVFNLAGGL